MSFVLAEGCQIKDIALRDAAMDGNSQDDGGEHCHGRAFTPDSRSDGCTGGEKLAPADQPPRDLMESVKSEAGLGRPKR